MNNNTILTEAKYQALLYIAKIKDLALTFSDQI